MVDGSTAEGGVVEGGAAESGAEEGGAAEAAHSALASPTGLASWRLLRYGRVTEASLACPLLSPLVEV